MQSSNARDRLTVSARTSGACHLPTTRLSAACAVLLVAAAGGACAAEPPSALGVSFGLTPPQVAAKLGTSAKLIESGTANISYGQARKVLPASDYLAVQSYEVTNPGLTAQQVRDGMKAFYSPDFKNEKLIGLTREQFFQDGFRPQPKLRAQDYIDKFGKPSFAGQHGGSEVLLWSYEADGSLRTTAHPEAVRHCAGTFLESRSVIEVMRRPLHDHLTSATICGAATMQVSMALDPQGAVRNLHFSMMDYQRIFESLDALEARIRKAEADALKSQNDRTKTNKPAL